MLRKEDKKEFAQIMYGVAGNFGGSVTTHTLKLQFKLLQEYTLPQITQAGIWLLLNRTEKFPAVPTVKEFIDAIGKLINPVLSLEAQAHEQCDIILLYLKDRGGICDHVFKQSSTRYLMEHRWGFKMLGDMTKVDLKWFRKEFVKAWIDIEEHSRALDNQIIYQGKDRIEASKVNPLLNIKQLN